MRTSALLPVVAAGAVPFVLIGLIAVGTGTQWVAWTSPQLWQEHFGDYNGQVTTSGATALVATNSSLFVAGYSNLTNIQSFIVGGLQGTAFVARYDSNGNSIWTSTFNVDLNTSAYPGSLPDPVVGIGYDSGDIYIGANYNASSWIIKYDDIGQREWASSFGGQHSELLAIAASASGVYAIGYSGVYGENFRKYDSNGNMVWNQSSTLVDINASPLGVYGLTESELVRYDSNGNPVWTRRTDCPTYLCFSTHVSSDATAIYVLERNGSLRKYAPDGSSLWNSSFLVSSGVEAATITSGPSGTYAFVRLYQTAPDLLVKVGSNGGIDWTRDITQRHGCWKDPMPCLSA